MRAALVVAAVLAGVVAGAVWTWVQPDRYRADAGVLVRSAAGRSNVSAVEALAESSLVAQNVAQTLHLRSPPKVSAHPSNGGVIRVSVEAGDSERARQIDAEVVTVLTQTAARRLGENSATVLDPAHVAEQTSPTAARNFIVAGLIGLALGIAAAVPMRRRGRRAGVVADPGSERLLRTRVAEVAKRERALARRAGELAKRDAHLSERERELDGKAAALEASRQELKSRETPVQVVPQEPAPPPPPEPAVPAPAGRGRWNLGDLERFVHAHPDAASAQQEEWRTYLFLLRQHADAEGALPSSFDSLVNEVFPGAG